MADRVDINETRAGLIKSWQELPIADDLPADGRQKIEQARRAAAMCAEIICFGLAEIERDQSRTINIIADDLGEIVGNAVFQLLGEVDGGSDEENQRAAHALIHIFTDAVSRSMHALHYADTSGSAEGDALVVHGGSVEIVRKPLPDA